VKKKLLEVVSAKLLLSFYTPVRAVTALCMFVYLKVRNLNLSLAVGTRFDRSGSGRVIIGRSLVACIVLQCLTLTLPEISSSIPNVISSLFIREYCGILCLITNVHMTNSSSPVKLQWKPKKFDDSCRMSLIEWLNHAMWISRVLVITVMDGHWPFQVWFLRSRTFKESIWTKLPHCTRMYHFTSRCVQTLWHRVHVL